MKFQIVALSLVFITICSCTKDPMTNAGGPLGVLDVYNGDYTISSNTATFSPATLNMNSNVQMPPGAGIDIFLYDEEGYELQWLGTLYDDGDKYNNDRVARDGHYNGSVSYSRYDRPGSYFMMATATHNANLTSNRVYIKYVE